MDRLAGKSALVTGGASGIGRAVAQLLAAEGARVGLLDVSIARGTEVANAIRESGGDAVAVKADVSKGDEVRKAVEAVIAAFGSLHIVVNCAAVWEEGSIEALSEQAWHRMIDINLKGTYLVCKHSIPYIRRSGRGSIVNFGSTSSLAGSWAAPHYGASKGGVMILSKSLALALASDGIRVNTICPGPTMTPLLGNDEDLELVKAEWLPLVPLGRMASPKEIAWCVVFLASDEASYVTGSELVVDGGFLAR